ncbi:ABC transporter permease [Nocardioides bruguierae]|uniref:ABC transporter permease n=1 Tax=Nocardioides bruguierae TaxID=2945102 RepID=UPI00202079E1|nr:ABC transporter permease [Nocardioides bruguierae]MCL8024487.1 ABC transporter permease [Nocardioides bruguierae]
MSTSATTPSTPSGTPGPGGPGSMAVTDPGRSPAGARLRQNGPGGQGRVLPDPAPGTPSSSPGSSPDDVVARGRSTASRLTSLMPVIALVALVAALTAADPGFLTERSLVAVVNTAAPLAVLAAGATIVVLCGGIDLSIAALCSLASVLLALWLPDLGGVAILAVVLAAAALGALQGLVHVVARIPSFVVTLGGMSVFGAVALVVSGAGTVGVSNLDPLRWATMYVGGRVPVAVLVAVLVVAAIAFTIRLTPLDSCLKATGYAESAARLAGIHVDAVKVGAFALSGACAGLAAVLLVSRNFSGSPTMADSLLLPAVAAIVVGGTAITGGHGGVWRTLAGALVVTLLRVGLSTVGVSSAYEQILYGAVIVAAVALTLDRSKVLTIK